MSLSSPPSSCFVDLDGKIFGASYNVNVSSLCACTVPSTMGPQSPLETLCAAVIITINSVASGMGDGLYTAKVCESKSELRFT